MGPLPSPAGDPGRVIGPVGRRLVFEKVMVLEVGQHCVLVESEDDSLDELLDVVGDGHLSSFCETENALAGREYPGECSTVPVRQLAS